ncbi:hypothetical protein E3N88_00799 [Mikania micrantha]|uniref:Uncharacterized protein n=1 Tax=Mikania micrantha TaxID=192012 RepID=A0A5N6PZW3_9ASTR|nr:hypothetical protein E3N88_00799 [Mikania micrantha]
MMSTPPTTQEEQQEIETVPETQHQDVESGPSQRKRAHRRKAPEEPREKPTQIPWSSEEQMALARAWLEVTEDPQEDNSIRLNIEKSDVSRYIRSTRFFGGRHRMYHFDGDAANGYILD